MSQLALLPGRFHLVITSSTLLIRLMPEWPIVLVLLFSLFSPL